MEQQAKLGKYSLFTKCIALVLTVALMVNFTLAANAAASTEYVREVILVVANDEKGAETQAAKASEKTDDKRKYYVVDTPVYESETTKTWLCYATTTKPGLALTSIKAMNMTGGWSYDAYNDLLDSMWDTASILVDDLLIAVREYNTNLAAGKSDAVYAKSVFDLLKNEEDDSEQLVSAFFAEAGTEPLATEQESAYKARLTRFVMESNTSILGSIENTLMLACSDTKGNLLDALEDPVYLSSIDGIQYSENYHQYDLAADDLINSLAETQKELALYENSKHMFTDAMEQMVIMQEEELNLRAEDEQPSEEEYPSWREKTLAKIRSDAAEEDDNPFGFNEDQIAVAQELCAQEAYYNERSPEEQQLYTTGRMLYNALTACEYLGYTVGNDREYTNLLGLIERYDLNNTTQKNKYKRSDFYPLLNRLSDGQLAMMKVGFTQLIASITTDTEVFALNKSATLAALNAKAEEGMEIKEGETVSVYYGVDRSLFEKDSGIALTSKALDASQQETPLGESQAKYQKMERIATYAMIASAGASALTLATFYAIPVAMKIGFLNGAQAVAGVSYQFYEAGTTVAALVNRFTQQTLITISTGAPNNAFTGTFMQCTRAFIMVNGGITMVFAVANIIAIAAFIISMIVTIVASIAAKNADKPYIDIPRVMCSYQQIFTDSGQSDEEDYIYYYGVKNPLLDQTDQDRAAAAKDENGKETTYILNYRVADVANWDLHGENREWIALYASTDERAGKLILAGSFFVTTERNAIGAGYTPVERFNIGSAYDMHTYYGYCAGSSVGQRFVAYQMDRYASASGSASVFSGVSPIGTLVVGIVAGGAIGTLITYFVFKKRKTVQ